MVISGKIFIRIPWIPEALSMISNEMLNSEDTDELTYYV